jgi:hypothetical protein
MSSLITREDLSYAFDEAVADVTIGSMSLYEAMWPEFFEAVPMTGPIATAAAFGDVGAFSSKAEGVSLPEVTIVQVAKQTFTATVYGAVLSVTDELIRDQSWIGMQDFATAFSQNAMECYESEAARVLNNATTTTYHRGEDGLAICANTHTDPDGTTLSAFDNYHAYDLTSENLVTVRNAMQRTPGYTSDKHIKMRPNELWVPIELQDNGLKIVASQQVPGSNNNDINGFFGWKLYVWDFLSDTNRWFITDPVRRRMNARCYVSWPLEIVFDQQWKQLTRSIGAYCRFVFGVKNSRFIACSEAS